MALVAGTAALLWARPASAEWVVYLDYGGNPTAPCGLDVQPSGATAIDRALLAREARAIFQAYDITFTDAGPSPDPAFHAYLGPVADPQGVGSCASAVGDCDTPASRELSVVYADDGDPEAAAAGLAWAVARAGGLGAVVSAVDIMGTGTVVTNECHPAQDSNMSVCVAANMADCGDETMQNTHLRLLATFGPAVADTEGPTITFVNPTEGAFVDPTFDLTFEVIDNHSPQILDLRFILDDLPPIDAANQVGPSFTFPVDTPLPEGPHTITVEATDEDGNTTTELMMFSVGTAPDGTDTGTDPDTDTDADTSGSAGTGSATGAATATDTGTDPGMDTDGSSGESSGSGCGCSVPGGAPGPAFLLVPALVRRRRKHGVI